MCNANEMESLRSKFIHKTTSVHVHKFRRQNIIIFSGYKYYYDELIVLRRF